MQKARSGIKELDKALEGGFERGSMILLKENTGTPADMLCKAFIEAGLAAKDYCYILGTTHSPRKIVTGITDVQKWIGSGRLRIIDGFTDAYNWKEFKSEEKWVADITEFKTIHTALRTMAKNIPENASVRGVVDSISTIMFSNNDRDSVNRETYAMEFFQHQSVLHKKFDICSVYVICPGAHDEYSRSMYDHLSDYVLNLKREEKEGNYRTLLTVEKVPYGEPPESSFVLKAQPKLQLCQVI
jgi:KaiC/GvpD/RAD55 family RecA-like ATPase